mgnify:CR=1 FL=1
MCTFECGDSILVENECEDLNQDSGDGCSEECEVERGYECTKEMPSICESICGDGIII